MSKAGRLTAACALSLIFAAAVAVGAQSLAAPMHAPSTTGEVRTAGGQAASGGLSEAHPHLTVGECQGLGGKVVPYGGCGSTFACQAVDKNGVVHQACITSDKH